MADAREPDSDIPTTAAPAERQRLMAFAADAETEAALRQGLLQCGILHPTLQKADIARAISILRKTETPDAVIVDIAGHPDPNAALTELANVVEPDTRILAIGDRRDIDFYREITQDIGVLEYLYKPIAAAAVTQLFGPHLQGRLGLDWARRGGRVITVTGTRGGAGATTIAVNLAAFLAEQTGRRTLVLDADLCRGTVAMTFGVTPPPGLRAVLQTLERIDDAFLERLATQATPGLDVLAAEDPIANRPRIAPDAPEKLLNALRRNYHFIVIDARFGADGFYRDLATLSHQSVLVMDPSLPAIRDAARLLQLPGGPLQTHRPLVVLNRSNRKGAIAISDISATMRQEPDVVIPELPGHLLTGGTPVKPERAAGTALSKAMVRLGYEIGVAGSIGQQTRGPGTGKRWT